MLSRDFSEEEDEVTLMFGVWAGTSRTMPRTTAARAGSGSRSGGCSGLRPGPGMFTSSHLAGSNTRGFLPTHGTPGRYRSRPTALLSISPCPARTFGCSGRAQATGRYGTASSGARRTLGERS